MAQYHPRGNPKNPPRSVCFPAFSRWMCRNWLPPLLFWVVEADGRLLELCTKRLSGSSCHKTFMIDLIRREMGISKLDCGGVLSGEEKLHQESLSFCILILNMETSGMVIV
jgi:hypothetical protein